MKEKGWSEATRQPEGTTQIATNSHHPALRPNGQIIRPDEFPTRHETPNPQTDTNSRTPTDASLHPQVTTPDGRHPPEQPRPDGNTTTRDSHRVVLYRHNQTGQQHPSATTDTPRGPLRDDPRTNVETTTTTHPNADAIGSPPEARSRRTHPTQMQTPLASRQNEDSRPRKQLGRDPAGAAVNQREGADAAGYRRRGKRRAAAANTEDDTTHEGTAGRNNSADTTGFGTK